MISAPSEQAGDLHSAPKGGTVQRYGVILWRKDRRGRMRVLLVKGRGRGGWGVPTGRPTDDREAYLSAALEAFQEAGVIGEIQPDPLASYRYAKEAGNGALQRRQMTVFGLRVRGTLTNWPERAHRTRQWFNLDEAADLVGDRELARVLRSIQSAPESLATADWTPVGDHYLDAAQAMA